MKKIALLLTALILVSCHTIILQGLAPILRVTGVSATSVSLVWSKETSTSFASYKLYRSADSTVTTEDSLVTDINNSDDTTFTDSNLIPLDTYYYRLFVYFTGGDSTESNVVEATTSGQIPLTLSITQTGVYSISLVWTQDTSASFISYVLFRSVDSGVTIQSDLVDTITNQTDTTLVDSFLCPNQTYYYTLFSISLIGGATQSNEVSGTTGVPTTLTIGVCPQRYTVAVGDTFSINVWVGAVTDLFQAALELQHDYTKIEALGGEKGDFLGDNVLFQAIPDSDRISISNTRLAPATGVDGTGILATVKYRALATGQTSLSFIDATLTLINSVEDTLDVEDKKEGLIIVQ